MNFKKWLENIDLMEAKTEYPGLLPLPNDVIKEPLDWCMSRFINATLHSVTMKLDQTKKSLQSLKNDIKIPNSIHEKEIREKLTPFVNFRKRLDKDYDLENEIKKGVEEIYRSHKKIKIKYDNLLDLFRYINKLGIKQDDNFISKYDSAIGSIGYNVVDSKKFTLNLPKFKNIDAKKVKVLVEITINHLKNKASYENILDDYDNMQIDIKESNEIDSIQSLQQSLEQLKSTIEHEFMHMVTDRIYFPSNITMNDNGGVYPKNKYLSSSHDDNDINYYLSKAEYPSQMISILGDFKSQVSNNTIKNKKFKVDGDVIMGFLGNEQANKRVFDKYGIKMQVPYFVEITRHYKPEVLSKLTKDFYKSYMRSPVNLRRSSFGNSSYISTYNL